jgi:hypothetical protein
MLLSPEIPHTQTAGLDIKFARILNNLLALQLINRTSPLLISMTLI